MDENQTANPTSWKFLNEPVWKWFAFRNTPTGVGKTYALESQNWNTKKHPHRRGEDFAGAGIE